jgi:hypothetical protein
MSFVDFKEVSTPSAGSSTKYGSQDLLEIMQILNGKTVGTRRPRINNPWLWLGSQDIGEISEPAAPSSGTQRLYIDSADHHIKLKNSASVVLDISAGGGSGGWNPNATETITNKTINATNNTITDTSIATGDILKSNGTKFVRLARGTANQVLAVNSGGTDLAWTTLATGGDMVLANAQTNTGAKTFNDTTLLLRNPANTFSTTLGSGAQTAARTFTFPVTTSDTIDTIAASTTLSNKTFNVDQNTLKHSTTNSAGDLLVNNATQFARRAKGTALQYLRVNSGATDLEWADINAGSKPFVLNVATGGSGDYTTIKAALDFVNTRPTTEHYIVEISPEDYVDNTGATLTRGNVSIRGAGIGLTRWIGGSSLTDATGLLSIEPTNSATGDTLSVNALIGDKQVTVTPVANAANYLNGDWVLIKSSKVIDDEFGGRFQGELHQVLGTSNATTGVVPLDTTIYETYATTDTARIARLPNFYSNISVSGITFTSQKTSVGSTLTHAQAINAWFIKNLHIRNCEFTNLFHTGIELRQVFGGHVEDCNFKDIFDITPAANTYYGVNVMGACMGVVVDGCTFDNMRHGVTTDSWGGGNQDGRCRNVVIDGNHSRNSTTAHFDCHQGAEGVIFSNNVCIADDGSGNAFQVRSPVLIIGNIIKSTLGRGVYLFYTSTPGSLGGASGSAVIGNWISNAQNGVFIDYGVTKIIVAGNQILNSSDYAITNHANATMHSGDNSVIQNNYISDGTFSTVVNWDSAANCLITNNWVSGTGSPTGIFLRATHTTSLNHVISGNTFVSTNTPAIVENGTTHIIRNNMGYKTEASGTATVTAAATSVVVTHGLGYTPAIADIAVTRTNATTNAGIVFWVTTVTSTQFTINVSGVPGASTATFSWQIKRT